MLQCCANESSVLHVINAYNDCSLIERINMAELLRGSFINELKSIDTPFIEIF